MVFSWKQKVCGLMKCSNCDCRRYAQMFSVVGRMESVVKEFEMKSFAFWEWFNQLPIDQRQALSSTHAYHQVLQTCFNITQQLREELMKGSFTYRTYNYTFLPDRIV